MMGSRDFLILDSLMTRQQRRTSAPELRKQMPAARLATDNGGQVSQHKETKL
jgi:hypothetical protein